MELKNSNNYKHIHNFNPEILNVKTSFANYRDKILNFDAGEDYKNFNSFLTDDSLDLCDDGDGVTYLVWNVINEEEKQTITKDLVGYFTLSSTAIPYEDRIRLDDEEAKKFNKEFDITICGISALEIKMFALNKTYQDLFYEYDGVDMPISAWVLHSIIDYATQISSEIVGFKAIFLHSVEEAESFYSKNGFVYVPPNVKPLYSIDGEFKAMYLPIHEVYMNYDE